MIHVRVVCPSHITPGLIEALDDNAGVVNLVVLPGAARHPAGDALQFDVITAEANGVLSQLRGLGIDRTGSITIDPVEASISDIAARAEGREPPSENFSPIWETVIARIHSLATIPRAGTCCWPSPG